MITEKQVDFIEEDLERRGLTFNALREELLDHVCCLVEDNIQHNQMNFDEAYTNALEAFDSYNFEDIQSETLSVLYTKSSISMKKVFLMTTLLVVALIYGAKGVEQMAVFEPPSRSPLDGEVVVTSGFGMRMHPVLKTKKLHRGIDFKVPIGTPIYATSDGTIEKVVDGTDGYGKHLKIKHDENYQTLYAHLSKFNVKEGDKVKKGDIIAYSGNTGKSMKPHLHYEVKKDGKPVDPEDYFGK